MSMPMHFLMRLKLLLRLVFLLLLLLHPKKSIHLLPKYRPTEDDVRKEKRVVVRRSAHLKEPDLKPEEPEEPKKQCRRGTLFEQLFIFEIFFQIIQKLNSIMKNN